MPSFCKTIILGNLTRDPESRDLPSGNILCQFGMAVNREWKDTSGERQQKTTFVDVTFFGKPAEVIAKYVEKGDLLLVEGRLELDQWESESGEKRSKLKIVGESFQLMPNRRDNARSEPSPSRAPAREPARPKEQQEELPAFDDDDVPF